MAMHKNIKLLNWFNFFLDFRLYAPVMILYFTQVSGSFARGMSVFSVTMLSAAIFEIPTGLYSDRIGRKKSLVFGAVATLVSVTFYALGTFYWVLLLGAILEGLARSFYSGNNESLLHDTLKESGQEKEYAKYFGRTNSALQLALAIAAVLGAIVAHYSFSAVMWLSVLPAFVGLLISFQVVEPNVLQSESANIYLHLKEALLQFRENAKLRQISLASIAEYVKGEAGHLFLPTFFATVIPVWAIGVLRFMTHLGAAASFYSSGKVISRFGEFRVLMTRIGYSIVSNLIALMMASPLSSLIIATNSLFYGAGTVSKSSLLQEEYTQAQRSTMGSLNSLAGGVGFAIVALLLGLMADVLTPAKALLLLQILGLVPLIIWWRLFRKSKNSIN